MSENGNYMALKLLDPHPGNRQFSVKSAAMTSLITSVKAKGVMVPLIVRPHGGKGRHQVVCGHRRLVAAATAGLNEVPVDIRDIDDKMAVELMVCENLEREDPTPLDQAAGIALMVEAGWDLDSIAGRLGLSLGVVSRRHALTKLIEPWRKIFADPEHELSGVPLGVMESIARLPSAQQNELIPGKYGWFGIQWFDVAAFNRWLSQEVLHALSGAPWKLDDAALNPKVGACSECPKRSSVEPMLFDDLQESKKGGRCDRCLDKACWDEKAKRALAAKLATMKQEHKDLVVLETVHCRTGHEKSMAERLGVKPANDYEFEPAKKAEKGAQPALVIDGPQMGTLKWVKPYSSGVRSGSAKKVKGEVMTLAQRRKALEARRLAWVVDETREELEKIAAGERETFETAKRLGLIPDTLRMIAAFGIDSGLGMNGGENEYGLLSGWAGFDKMAKWTDEQVANGLRRSVANELICLLGYSGQQYVHRTRPHLERILPLLGTSLKVALQKACEAIPEPKGWAKLKADGTPKSANTQKLRLRTILRVFVSLWLMTAVSLAQTTPAASQPTHELAFDGADGFGKYAQGGRGGKTIQVDNLNDDGPGSLRDAIERETGPRVVLFDRVGGTIRLDTPIRLAGAAGSFVTIDATTAARDGIQLAGDGIIIDGAHDIIIRGLRIRPGIGPLTIRDGEPTSDKLAKKCILIFASKSREIPSDIIIDRCSLEWGLDDNLGAGPVRRLTVQWCIVGEGSLYGDYVPAGCWQGNAGWSRPGAPSQGMVIGQTQTLDDCATIHHCLFINNGQRNPWLYCNGSVVEFINNFTCGHASAMLLANYAGTTKSTRVNVGGCVWRGACRPVCLAERCDVTGKQSSAPTPGCIWIADCLSDTHGPYPWNLTGWLRWPLYPLGNTTTMPDGYIRAYYRNGPLPDGYAASKPHEGSRVVTHQAAALWRHLLYRVGALPHDAVDRRLIMEMLGADGNPGIGGNQQPPKWAADGSVISTGHDPWPELSYVTPALRIPAEDSH